MHELTYSSNVSLRQVRMTAPFSITKHRMVTTHVKPQMQDRNSGGGLLKRLQF
jgi:hypothetical protein